VSSLKNIDSELSIHHDKMRLYKGEITIVKIQKITASALAMVVCLSVLPSYSVLAEDQTDQAASKTTNSDSLGPRDLEGVLANAGAATLALDGGADLLKKQSDLDLQDLKSYDSVKNAVTQLPRDQIIVKRVATDWQKTIKPEVMQMVQNIVGYNTKFQQYYPILESAAESNKKETLKQGLNLFMSDIKQKKAEVDRVITQLQNYSDSLSSDAKQFQVHTDIINNKLHIDNVTVSNVDTKNKEFGYSLLIAFWGLIGATFIGCLFGGISGYSVSSLSKVFRRTVSEVVQTGFEAVGFAVGFLGVLTATSFGIKAIVDAYNKNKNEEAQSNTRLENEAMILDVTNSNVQSMRNNVKNTINCLKEISKKWSELGDNYQAVIDDVDTSEDLNDSITSQLEEAKDHWAKLKNKANDMYGAMQTPITEQITQAIQDQN